MNYTGVVHQVGAPVDGVQHCLLCGEVILDNRGAMVQSGSEVSFWDEGPVSKMGSITFQGAEENFPYCNEGENT